MSWWKRVNWPTSLFLVLTPVVAALWAFERVTTVGVSAAELTLLVLFYVATAVSITAGYHRLFAHGAYDCRRFVKVFYLLFGAAAFQQSVLVWGSEHRRHHGKVDAEGDPYNIRRGFLWAHIGWLMIDNQPEDFSNVPDLEADVLIRLQHRYYFPLAFLVCFGLPLAIGWAIGNPWGVLLWAGLVRLVLAHHATFFVNSLAHTLGRRPYSLAATARDSVVTALLTFGEGYHNFHHRFATDYRNGVRRYQWDPTKWLIRTMAAFGWAWNLYRVPRERIVRAQLEVESERLLRRLEAGRRHGVAVVRERLAGLARAVESAAAQLGRLERQRYGAHAWRAKRQAGEERPAIRELRAARRRFQASWRQWRSALVDLRNEASRSPLVTA
jgi:stearoyl-CoA desaturase (delta-9 desaturase)